MYRTNSLLDKVQSLSEGDVIGIDTGDNKDRKYGIGHVGIVVQKEGKLYLAESSASYGVIIRPLDKGLKIFESEAKKSGKENSMFIGKGLPK